jgi:hypothetical protein
MQKSSYSEILKEIDKLRAIGVEDTDPRIKKLKVKLWSHLEKRNKNRSTSIVPTVTAIKTIKLESNPLGETKIAPETPADTKIEPKTAGLKEKPYAKYVLLGVVVAVAVICYKFFRKD